MFISDMCVCVFVYVCVYKEEPLIIIQLSLQWVGLGLRTSSKRGLFSLSFGTRNLLLDPVQTKTQLYHCILYSV